MPSVPTLVNVLAGVTKAVALLNSYPDSQAAALRCLENRKVSLSDLGLLVDLRGTWLDSSFRDLFWHCSVFKFRGWSASASSLINEFCYWAKELKFNKF